VLRNPILPKAAAEFLGTFAIVFFGCGAVRLGLSPAAVSAVFGLTVAVMIYALGHLCGAHFNPAVTLGFAVARHFPLGQVAAYWLAQTAGAFTATGLLLVLIPAGSGLGAATAQLSNGRAFGWELVLTFFLMLVIVAVATDSRAEGTMAGAAIGGYVAIGSMVGGPLTGAAMNPARYLAPAVFEGSAGHWWVYLPAAFLGAVLAAMLYERLRNEKRARRLETT
jgi:MIP family channel proteins